MSIRIAIRKYDGSSSYRCNGTKKVSFSHEVACELASTLNGTFVPIPYKDRIFGSCDNNGTCTGVIRMLVDDQADVVTDCFWYTEGRHKAAEFSNPIFVDDYGFLISPLLFENRKRLDQFSLPFSLPIIFLIWSICFLWIIKDIFYYRVTVLKWPNFETFVNIVWRAFVEFMRQSTDPRILHLLTSTIILLLFWAANRGVVLVMEPAKLPFKSVGKLITQMKLGNVQLTFQHKDMLRVTGLDKQHPELVEAYWSQRPMPPLLPKLHIEGSQDLKIFCSNNFVVLDSVSWKHLKLVCTPFFTHMIDEKRFFSHFGKFCSILISRNKNKMFREEVNRVLTIAYNIANGGPRVADKYFWDLEKFQQEIPKGSLIHGGMPETVNMQSLLMPVIAFFTVLCGFLSILLLEITIFCKYNTKSKFMMYWHAVFKM